MKTKKPFQRLLNFLLSGLFSVIAFTSAAQVPPCDNPCPPGAQQSTVIALCKFSWSGTVTCGANSYTTSLDSMPFIQVIINYRIKDCNGIITIVIDDYVYMEDSDYWINDCFSGCTTNPSIASAIAASGCGYPVPATSNSIKTAVAAAIAQLMTNLNITTQSSLEVYFPGACYSLVHLSFPSGSFWTQPNDLGGTDTIRLSPGSDVTQFIPCDDACCKVTYTLKVISLANGQTQYTWIASGYQAGAGPPCDSQPLPDYNLFPNKLTATVINPANGLPTTVYGTLVSQDPCTLICPSICMPPGLRPSIATDINKDEIPLRIMVGPTLVNNYVYIKSNKTLARVQLYDLGGKMVMNVAAPRDGEVNTGELKSGTYFMRIYFDEKDVHTVKIIKQ